MQTNGNVMQILKRWESVREVLEYHGLIDVLAEIPMEIYVAKCAIRESISGATGIDDALHDGALSVLDSVGSKIQDLLHGRLPEDVLPS